MTKGVRKAGKTLKDSERRRLAKRSRAEHPVPGTGYSLPPGWAVVWCDGGSRGNPGPAAYAFVICADDGTDLASAAVAIGVATVGTAEYRAVVAGLEAAAELSLDRVELRTDSRLVIRHLGDSGRPLRNPALAGLRDQALAAAARMEAVRYRWVPAELNGRADALVGDLLV